jgi:bromodomain-containing protein 8
MATTPVSSPSGISFGNAGSTPGSQVGSPTTPLAPGVQQRLLLKQTAIDTWSLREQLGLASAVQRSGDQVNKNAIKAPLQLCSLMMSFPFQNWVSVSRQMKPFSEDGRPADWFSQKNCALQYNLLLGKVDTPRRKRGERAVESVETPGEAIVKSLTTDRIKELRRIIEAENMELLKLEEEVQLLKEESIDDEKLTEIEAAIETEDKEEDEKKEARERWLSEREIKKQAILAALKAHSSKLPLKGAAAAAVQQAGAARRASTQSERSSFSDVDSPAGVAAAAAAAAAIATPVNHSVIAGIHPISISNDGDMAGHMAQTPKKESEEKEDTKEGTSMPSPLLSSLLKSPTSSTVQPEDNTVIIPEMTTTPSQSEALQEEKPKPTEVEEHVPSDVNMEITEETSDTKQDVKIPDDSATNNVSESESNNVETEKEAEPEHEAAVAATVVEPEDIKTEAPATPKDTVEPECDDEEDDEVILKKELDVSLLDDLEARRSNSTKGGHRSSRSKKPSEVSEDDDGDDSGSRSRRDTRSKKLSERSDDAEDSPAPPPTTTSRATRRSKKSEDTSTERDDASTAENKRISRLKDTDSSGRGRRGSGATTTSRSSSPGGSGDEESETDQSRTSRSRRKSGRGANISTSAPEGESAPPSPVPSATDLLDSSPSSDEWKKNATTLMHELRTHRCAEKVFSDDVVDSRMVALKEMELSLIRKNIESGVIKSNLELHHSLLHMFLNITMSVSSDTEVTKMKIIISFGFLPAAHAHPHAHLPAHLNTK